MDWHRLRERFDDIDQGIAATLREEGVVVLRYSLALIFIWFGALKPLGLSPAAGLATRTVPWLPADLWVPLLGFWEVAIGLCFLYRPLIRVALPLMGLHMIGTFSTFILLPKAVFARFPFVLTMEGQYVVKNLVLIGAAMVVGGLVRQD